MRKRQKGDSGHAKISASTFLYIGSKNTLRDTNAPESMPLVENRATNPNLRSNCIRIQYVVLPLDSHNRREYCCHPIGL